MGGRAVHHCARTTERQNDRLPGRPGHAARPGPGPDRGEAGTRTSHRTRSGSRPSATRVKPWCGVMLACPTASRDDIRTQAA